MWTEEQDTALVNLWRAGQSASAISATLTGRSRNAVIGRIHRLREAGIPNLRSERPPRKPRGPLTRPRLRVVHVRRAEDEYVPDKAVSLAGPKRSRERALTPSEPPAIVIRGDEKAPDGTPATLLELCSAACKWPVSSDGDKHLFCNKVRRGDSAYCDEHVIKSFAPRTEKICGKLVDSANTAELSAA